MTYRRSSAGRRRQMPESFWAILCLAIAAPGLAAVAGVSGDAGVADPERSACESLNDAGRFAEALPHCRAAIEHLDAPGENRPGDRESALNSFGLALEMTGDRQRAESAYREALRLTRELGRPQREALVLSNLAALAIGGGDYAGALDWLAAEEDVARTHGEEAWAAEEISYVRINRSVALEQLGAYEEALAEIRPPALPASRVLPGAESPVEDPVAVAARTVNLAVLYRNLGDPRRALTLLEAARLAYERSGDRSALANVHLNRGLVFELNLHAPESAEPEFARALRLAQASGDRGEQVRTLLAIGSLRLDAGDLVRARTAFESARSAAVESSAAAGEWSAETGLARVARAAGDPDEARRHLRAAMARIEDAGARLENSTLRGDLLADQRAVYALAVELLAERAVARMDDRLALEALTLAERARARELLDALVPRGARAVGRNPRQGSSTTAAQPLSAEEIAALAPRLGPTLVYFFGDRKLWRWDNLAGPWRVAAAGVPRSIAERVAHFHRDLALSAVPSETDRRSLGQELLPSRLPKDVEVRIVPDGTLFYLPFELLPAAEDPALSLVDLHAVSYLPSLALFAHLRPQVAEGAHVRWRFTALAAPVLPPATAGGSLAGILARRSGLPPLPGAESEVRAAAARLGGRTSVEVGREASEGRLRERCREGTEILHVAAHTVVDDSLAGGVALFLAADRRNGSDSNGSGDSSDSSDPGNPREKGADDTDGDGLVTAPELARMPLTVNLAVLAGCRTALPENRRGAATSSAASSGGRALASLSGALLGAGARGVVASLWPVQDAATAAFMEQFYFELARGERPAEALRHAKLRLARDARWNEPALWAGFVLLGDPGPVSRDRPSWSGLIAAIGLVAAGIALALVRRRQAGKR
ncbi:MAG: CHAT domain-containing protein [Thermoanaerobaculia bacterium]